MLTPETIRLIALPSILLAAVTAATGAVSAHPQLVRVTKPANVSGPAIGCFGRSVASVPGLRVPA